MTKPLILKIALVQVVHKGDLSKQAISSLRKGEPFHPVRLWLEVFVLVSKIGLHQGWASWTALEDSWTFNTCVG